MSWRPPNRKTHGLTLAEVLISASLLTLLTTLFFTAVLPALSREEWFSGNQDHLRNFIVAKERLSKRLRDARLLGDEERVSDPLALLEYQRPIERETDLGLMLEIDRREMGVWAPTIYQLRQRPEGLVERDREETFSKLMWRLEPTDSVTVTVRPDQREIVVNAQGRVRSSRANIQGTAWQYTLRVFVR